MRALSVAAACTVATSCAAPREEGNGRPLTREKTVRQALDELRVREAELRRDALGKVRFASTRMGVDPARVCAVGDRLIGLLRGSSELVVLDAALNELSRTSAPSDPVACGAIDDSQLAVVGAEPELRVYRSERNRLELLRRVPLPGAVSPRAIATSAGVVYVTDPASDALYVVRHDTVSKLPVCRRPIGLALTGRTLVINCLYDHALSMRPVDASGQPLNETARIENAGPFWAISAVSDEQGVLIAATGVENRALERFDGAFGYVDSFAYLFRVQGTRVERHFERDVCEDSVIVPKAIVLESARNGRASLWVSSGATDRLLRYDVELATGASTQMSFTFAPGISDLVRLGERVYAASPLLDSWVLFEQGATRAALKTPSSPLPEAETALRLGEALVFTSLMAPHASSDGHASRFTCETCHFEGGIDARVHHTGRGDVHVTTRPLFGLLRNAPHFSRALDPDLTSVAHNEFRVAGLGNPEGPWFTLRASEFPWLARLGIHGDVSPSALRRALLEFLAAFEFAPNPRTRGRSSFNSVEAEGAGLFREHCERCHAARLVSDDPTSLVAFDGWELSLFELGGPIVWARGDYEKTLVLPYVNERGTRVASLRRIVDKYPYLTNGTALSLEQVLQRSAGESGYFSHAAPRSQFSARERRALVAFLELL